MQKLGTFFPADNFGFTKLWELFAWRPGLWPTTSYGNSDNTKREQRTAGLRAQAAGSRSQVMGDRSWNRSGGDFLDFGKWPLSKQDRSPNHTGWTNYVLEYTSELIVSRNLYNSIYSANSLFTHEPWSLSTSTQTTGVLIKFGFQRDEKCRLVAWAVVSLRF